MARPRSVSVSSCDTGAGEESVRRPRAFCHDDGMAGVVIDDLIGVRILIWTSSSDLAERVRHAVRPLGADVVVVDQRSVPTQLGEGIEVLVIDPSMSNWLRAVSDVVERAPLLRPMLFGDLDGPDEFLAAVSAGVVGFCPRLATAGAIERSVCSVAESGASIPRSFTKPLVDLARRGRVVRTPAGDIAVTDREWAVLQQLVQRRSTQEIADAMFVTTGTVRSHVSTLMKKLGALDRDDLVALVLRGPGRSTA